MGGRWSRSAAASLSSLTVASDAASSSAPTVVSFGAATHCSSRIQPNHPIQSPPHQSIRQLLDEEELFACISPTRHVAHVRRRHRLWAAIGATEAVPEAAPAASDEDAPTIAFPGGGIYFYWQIGAIHFLKNHYDLSKARLVGASAGALTAALTGVCA